MIVALRLLVKNCFHGLAKPDLRISIPQIMIIIYERNVAYGRG